MDKARDDSALATYRRRVESPPLSIPALKRVSTKAESHITRKQKKIEWSLKMKTMKNNHRAKAHNACVPKNMTTY